MDNKMNNTTNNDNKGNNMDDKMNYTTSLDDNGVMVALNQFQLVNRMLINGFRNASGVGKVEEGIRLMKKVKLWLEDPDARGEELRDMVASVGVVKALCGGWEKGGVQEWADDVASYGLEHKGIDEGFHKYRNGISATEKEVMLLWVEGKLWMETKYVGVLGKVTDARGMTKVTVTEDVGADASC